jgi:hypothetical protein
MLVLYIYIIYTSQKLCQNSVEGWGPLEESNLCVYRLGAQESLSEPNLCGFKVYLGEVDGVHQYTLSVCGYFPSSAVLVGWAQATKFQSWIDTV